MLSIHGRSRREFLTVGSSALAGLTLPAFLRHRATASSSRVRSTRGFGKAEGVILLYLQGAPSHIDLWDPKPSAPAEIRGEFSPIRSRAPGMLVSEVLP
jgi:hypothetical protein